MAYLVCALRVHRVGACVVCVPGGTVVCAWCRGACVCALQDSACARQHHFVLALDELLICNPLLHDGLDFSFEAPKNVCVSVLVLLVADPIPNLCSGRTTILSVYECWHQGRLDEGGGITNAPRENAAQCQRSQKACRHDHRQRLCEYSRHGRWMACRAVPACMHSGANFQLSMPC